MALVVGCIAMGAAVTASPPGSVEVMITTASGETTAFEPAVTAVHAGGPIAITFRNGSSWAHNLVFTSGSTAATRTIVQPGTSDRLFLPPSPPGSYPFVCTIHDGMAGTLVLQP
jgi:plastocyanin